MTTRRLTPTTLGTRPSFGFGDRLGLATPGHVEACRRSGAGIEPIFPQQSIREMTRTGRNPQGVMLDALRGAEAAGWTGPTGADADHLKTTEDIDATAAAGFTFFTLDPSGFVDPHADRDDEATLRSKFAAVRPEIDWFDRLLGQSIRLGTGTVVNLDEQACVRAAVKYGRAIRHAVALSRYIDSVFAARGGEYEVELSVDETDQPTTLAEHYIIASECIRAGVKLVSLAPRFIGDFEKGVDYKGDVAALEASLRDHFALSETIARYKLSLHSGSDKLSIYPALARATGGRFHVKTAGTSYLEALRVVARVEPSLFRRVVEFARERYDRDKATYHVSATLEKVPGPDQIEAPIDLERLYLERWEDVATGQGFTQPGRQILHCTFGSVLTDATLGAEIRDVLADNGPLYSDILADHFGRHLDALRAGM